jgi:hypothetical protein
MFVIPEEGNECFFDARGSQPRRRDILN